MFKQKQETGFIDFCRTKEKALIRLFTEIASCIPIEMYKDDNRFDIGKFCCNELERDLGHIFRIDHSIGYDAWYLNKSRISIKFGKTNVFQQPSYRGVTSAKSIVIKNFRKVENERRISQEDINFDYLWAIYYKKTPKDLFYNTGVGLAYGVAKQKTVYDGLVEGSKDDHQLKVKLNNDEWDYFSDYKFEEIEVDDDRNSYNYKVAENYKWDLLRGLIQKGKGELINE
ncbi:MAG: hypothetical protein ACXADW_13920 [Candidatus Hodarchaeales archaeon]|jgi:hypothetical protein